MVDIDTLKRFLDAALYELKDEDVVYLNFREPGDKEWTHHCRVADVFVDLDTILPELNPATRLDLAARSGEVVVGLAAPLDKVATMGTRGFNGYSYKLKLPDDRIVCVVFMVPLGAAEHFMDQAADIPVPGIGGVTVVDGPDGGGQETFEPDDELIDDYIAAIDAMFDTEAEIAPAGDDDNPDEDEEGEDDGGTDEGADVQADVRRRTDRPGRSRRDDRSEPVGEDPVRVEPDGADDALRSQDAAPAGELEEVDAGHGARDDHVPNDGAVVQPRRRQPRRGGTAHRGDGEPDVGNAGAEPAGRSGDAGSGGVEGELSPETAARTVVIASNTTAKAKYKWRNVASTLGQFAEMMLDHPEAADKDGLCILQGELIGEERTKKAVRACYFMALDLDTGDSLADVQAKVRRLGRCAFLYSTHSHMKTLDDVARQQVLKFANGREIDDALLADYLREEKGVRRTIAESVRITDGALHTEHGVRIVFEHAPWPKFRLFFPLAEPFVFAERNAEGDLQKGLAEWKGKLHGLGEMLSVRIDASCVDPSRLFYSPRHRRGAPFVSWALLTDALLSPDDVPTIDSRFGDPFTQAAEFMLGKGRKIEISDDNRWLYGWVKRYNHKFEVHEWLRQYLPDYVVGERPGGEGVTTRCPHHELKGAHSSEGGQGTFAAPPDPGDERGFVWHCTHDHCREYDKLAFLDLVLQEGMVERRDLFDPQFLMLEQGEEDPAEWDLNTPHSRCFTELTRLTNKEITYPDAVRTVSTQWGEMDTMQQREVLSELSKIAQVTKRDVQKDIDAQIAARSVSPETLALAQANLEEQLKVAFQGREYAVLWNDGAVGVMRMGSQSERSMMPEIASKSDFMTYYENRKIPQMDEQGGVNLVPAAKAWFEWTGRKTYEGLCFEPDPARAPKGSYNLWKGFQVQPRKGGRWDLLADHVLENLCGGDEYLYSWVMTWIAHLFQFPGEKPGTALVFRGAKGTGKSFFGVQIGALVKPYFMVLASTQDIVGQFNSHLAGRLLVLGDEGVWGGNKRDDGALKNLVTSTSVAIERKHFSKVNMSNYTRFVFCSNEKWAVPSSWDRERRFLVLDVDPARQNDYRYFGAIADQLRNGGYEALLRDMLDWVPLDDDWRVLQIAPQTSAADEQKIQAVDAGHRFFVELIERGYFENLEGLDATEVDLYLDRPNLVAQKPLLAAFRHYVETAGADRNRARTEVRDFRRLLGEVMLAERDGDNYPYRPNSNEIIGYVEGFGPPKGDNTTVRCVRFPGLREIVAIHRAAGRYRFDPAWEEAEAA